MTPDDPRHGTNKGYLAGCDDTCCKTAHADYRRDLRTRQYLNGGPLRVNVIGTRRRLCALVALGWTFWDIDAELGKQKTYCHNMLERDTDWILKSTADAVAEVYERLSMRLPDESTGPRRQVASRARNLARRKGWAPPLAWDDIDDPNEEPSDWEYVPEAPVNTGAKSRADVLAELIGRGCSVTEACRVLKVSRAALQKWCANNGHRDMYLTLAGREAQRANQYLTRVAS